jgi:transcriptional regulator with XRE-family HTH domain
MRSANKEASDRFLKKLPEAVDKIKFGDRLREARRRAGKSQQAIADELACWGTTICAYENGRSEPSFERLKELCRMLDTDPNTLLGWNDDRD